LKLNVINIYGNPKEEKWAGNKGNVPTICPN